MKQILLRLITWSIKVLRVGINEILDIQQGLWFPELVIWLLLGGEKLSFKTWKFQIPLGMGMPTLASPMTPEQIKLQHMKGILKILSRSIHKAFPTCNTMRQRECHSALSLPDCILFLFLSSHGINRPFYCCVLSCLAFEWKWGLRWPCFDRNLTAFLM